MDELSRSHLEAVIAVGGQLPDIDSRSPSARLAAGEQPPEGKAWVHVTMFGELIEVDGYEAGSLQAQGILASVEAETPLRQPSPVAELGLHPSHAWTDADSDHHNALICSYSAGGCGAFFSTCCAGDRDDEARLPCEGDDLPQRAHNPYPAVPVALRRMKSGPPVKVAS